MVNNWRKITIGLITAVIVAFLMYLVVTSHTADNQKLFRKNVLYIFSQETSLDFPIKNRAQNIRLMTTPFLRDHQLQYPTFFEYSVNIKLYNKTNELIYDHDFYHKRLVTKAELEYQRLHSRLNKKVSGQALTPDLVHLPEHQIARGGRVVVSLKNKSDNLKRVGVQTALKEPSTKNYPISWQHLQKELKVMHQLDNIYGEGYLSGQQKRQLVTTHYNFIAPKGLVGENIKTLTLKRQVKQPPFIESANRRAGRHTLPATDKHAAMIPVPEDSSRLTFKVTPLYPDENTDQRLNLSLRRYASHVLLDPHSKLQFDSLDETKQVTLDQGLYEIYADKPVLVDVRYDDNQQLNLLKPAYTQALKLGANEHLTYDLVSGPNQPTPVRVDVRQFLSANKAGRVGYQFIDSNGSVLKQGQLNVPNKTNPFEFIAYPELKLDLSKRQSYFFVAPPQASQLRLSGCEQCMVNAYTRPWQLPIERVTGVDFYAPITAQYKVPDWFTMEPRQIEQWEQAQKIQPIRTQKTDPDREPFIENQQYSTKTLYPSDGYTGLSLLVPMRTDTAIEPSNTVYGQMPVNQKAIVQFKNQYSYDTLKPSIILMPEQDKEGQAVIYIDGRRVNALTVQGSPIKVELPKLSKDRHAIQIDSDGIDKAYINNVRPQKPWLLRMTYQLTDDQPLNFDVHKQKDIPAVIYGRAYFAPSSEKTRLLVTINPKHPEQMEPSKKYTFPRQRFVLNQPDLADSVGINRKVRLNGGKPFSVKLDQDLPPGQYEVSVQPLNGHHAYVSMVIARPKPAIEYEYQVMDKD